MGFEDILWQIAEEKAELFKVIRDIEERWERGERG